MLHVPHSDRMVGARADKVSGLVGAPVDACHGLRVLCDDVSEEVGVEVWHINGKPRL